MVDVITMTEINAPLRAVCDYALEPNNAPEWYQNIESVVWLTYEPLRVGSKMEFVANFLGRSCDTSRDRSQGLEDRHAHGERPVSYRDYVSV